MYLMMKKLASLILLVLIAACGPTPTAVPLTNPTLSNVLSATVAPQTVPTAIMQPTLAGAPANTAGFWLQVLSPLDEAIVNTPQVDVNGSAPAGAVISINEEILIVDIDQQFKTTVSLDEGPNLVEIIASDENGNELSVLLTITYEP